jgi:hypothetical protein
MPKGNRNFNLLRPLLVFIALLPMLLAAASARAESGERSLSEFYEALEPYGRWLEHPRWRFVWSPDVGDPEWRPYSRGRWVFTDEHGWLWVSDEEWGWATYHYGRWVLDDEYGWLWIPGTEWAPAWVVWRFSDDHIGWAPLPPEAEWGPERGELSFRIDYYDAPRFAPLWCFVHPRFMTRPRLHRYIAPRSRNSFIVRHTRPAIDYKVAEQRIVNHGVDVHHVERVTRQPIARLRVRAIETPREHGLHRGDRTVVGIYRPSLPPRPGAPERPRIRYPGDVRRGGEEASPSAAPLRRTPPPSRPSPAAEPPKAPAMPPGQPPPSDSRDWKGRAAAPPPAAPPIPPEGHARRGPLPEGDRRGKGNPPPDSRGFHSSPKVIAPPAPPPGAGPKPDQAPRLPPESRIRPAKPFENGRGRRWDPAPHGPAFQSPPRVAAPPRSPPGSGVRREAIPPPRAAPSGEGSGAPARRRERDERWPPR